ncbi:hypothetical protein [Dokdonella sp.]|uniref:hypothetical protein n=3 Tax=Dokdonella sp. TaxID=2291710 RepID=UPI0027BA6F1A|nr:hypothetical protein [Dokdonella sp.]
MTRLTILAAVLLLAACSKQAPTDAQLVTLLHAGGLARASDTSRPLDAIAVQCLSTHSGDAALVRDLPPAALTDAAKSQCRRRVELWLADSARNPDGFKFADVSAAPVAARAMQLYLANGGAPLAQAAAQPVAPSAESAPPAAPAVAPAVAASAPAAAPVPEPAPEPEAPMPDTITAMAEADNTCRDVQAAVAQGPFNPRLARFAEGCANMLQRDRERIERLQREGREADVANEVQKLVRSYRQAQVMLKRAGN